MRNTPSTLLIIGAALLALPAVAEEAQDGREVSQVVVTAARTVLPANALPLTVDVIGREDLREQAIIGGSVVDAVSALTPSFSPTRQKLSGAGETLRGRSPLYAINGVPQSTPLRDGSRDGFTIDPFFVDVLGGGGLGERGASKNDRNGGKAGTNEHEGSLRVSGPPSDIETSSQ